MNARTLLLALLGLVLVLALVLLLIPSGPTVERTMVPAIAAQQIQPYTFITQDMVMSGERIPLSTATGKGAWPPAAVIGTMSTDLINPGDLLTGLNAKPVREVRKGVTDMNLELVSFGASGERLLGGQIRPGHIINLYGNGRKGSESYTVLIEPRLWVVEVLAGSKDVNVKTPQPNPITGEYTEKEGGAEQAGSLVTVATTPQRAAHIIDALGSQGLQPYVTLAANQNVELALATPAPAATASLNIDIAQTLTAIAIKMRNTAPPPPPKTGGGGTR